MASKFSFGFSGDDIDIDLDENELDDATESGHQDAGTASTLPELVKAQKHEIDEWLSMLPSQISYNTCTISPFQEKGLGQGASASTDIGANTVTVARRDVFDIRAQLMVEDSAEEQNGELIAGLEKGDITPNFYEGGFKTWECSIDLAGLVVGEGVGLEDEGEDRHVIELGSGTAVPSLAVFAQLLARTETDGTTSKPAEKKKQTHFTFADYNSAVLRLVTVPNLLLTWNHFTTHRKSAQPSDGQSEDKAESQEEMLDITPDLVERFQSDLAHRGITVSFISGAWSPSFVELVFSSPELAGYRTLILASETIYSPASLAAFSETLLMLLRRSSQSNHASRALVAAKKVYFGVGGGVDEFLTILRSVADGNVDVGERMDVKSAGVGRTILEVSAST
ncbi:hypothetical protein AN1445.2 [Aspergillus nidulans FGSC A4]|uniref:protein-histidine N-methyltransferase n=1 Tax=Emericella nidulans (strain FGSC A4 / ATCC 38163 / CBS 112.46 / NRRL 194 / M139) TaxID=227321 RepID=Q5BDD5_EMENI|nr:protein-histidine N-methyltransferase [Aspergillus nidulans FGSC A4]EAA64575.1 hypothetical protein AN1445.2 [Aspergillus nidulans FGSC A4]CBF84871.1 TPA: conserved hypothetical protein [Aspergillus nidulans FGSC A4]|eukprot:XP_659049.1 hypothetical protein AN1445.2 [Aspergillus nidulans FGSC A4]